MSLLDLVPQSRTLDMPGGTVEVHPLRVRRILEIVARHTSIAQRLRSMPRDERVGAIREAVLSAGPDALDDILDAATRSEPGTAAQAALSAADEAEIVAAVLDLSLPADRLGNLMAEGERWAEALGLDSTPSSTPGQPPSTS
ncbi:hypothetical protein DLJ49_18760 [Rhodovulum sp. 12E13]|uniref:hypothetical protein n=1 Tax=Rhodovulum sp. 12E13 TaxID=2203891 RepID=UPI000E1A58E9|nr:hypothetical protein [Rhodovulum sp. 12E13]RDC69681.1 hypothetical protein DLJ49_18760 [Rhodovulum sp. 12E13]